MVGWLVVLRLGLLIDEAATRQENQATDRE
jgi:hypothetical protein